MEDLTNWNELLQSEMCRVEDSGPILYKSPNDDDIWSETFYAGYGRENGKPVLAWTEDRVYFPVAYDGSEWMGSAPRNPQSKGQEHVGGG